MTLSCLARFVICTASFLMTYPGHAALSPHPQVALILHLRMWRPVYTMNRA